MTKSSNNLKQMLRKFSKSLTENKLFNGKLNHHKFSNKISNNQNFLLYIENTRDEFKIRDRSRTIPPASSPVPYAYDADVVDFRGAFTLLTH